MNDADIANELTNLHVVVNPQVNLGTAPLVYALAVNPVIGLGSFLAQLFLSAPVMKALTYHMQVTGPWKAPVVTKLDAAKAEPPAAAWRTRRSAVAILSGTDGEEIIWMAATVWRMASLPELVIVRSWPPAAPLWRRRAW